jgi:asparagine synthase (glutamine-hydrolysing)
MEYVFNVPWEMKYQNGVEKALLRDATKDLLPEEILHRKKSPYPKTYHPAYEKRLVERLTAIIENPNSPITPLIDKEKVHSFMASHKELGKPWYGQLMAGPQLMAYFIQINYWMESYHLSL